VPDPISKSLEVRTRPFIFGWVYYAGMLVVTGLIRGQVKVFLIEVVANLFLHQTFKTVKS